MTPKEAITPHHVFWEKKTYRGDLERKFRNYRGLVVDVPFGVQSSLHANLEPPPKPTHDDMFAAMVHLNNTHHDIQAIPFWGVHRAIDYFSTRGSERNRLISQHLVQQLGYLTLGVSDER